jgi:polar amino acid transport system substrate-binding protein
MGSAIRSYACAGLFVATAAAAGNFGVARAADKPADLVPPDVRGMSTISVPSQGNYPPYEFYAEDNKTLQGIDVDILNAIGEVLNLKFSYVNTAVSAIVPAVQNGRYVIAISAIFDRPSDQQQVDFVDYFQSGTILLVQKGNPASIREWSDLCGKRAMGTIGQPSLAMLEDENKKCLAARKSAIDVQTGPGTAVRLQALQSGRTDAIPTDSSVGVYLSSRVGGIYEVATAVKERHLLGIVFRKGDTGFQAAVLAALNELKANGKDEQILAKWGVADGALKEFTINGAKQH